MIALTGQTSAQIRQSGGQPGSSLSGWRIAGREAVVSRPPSINLDPYRECSSSPFFPITPIPAISAIRI